MKKAIVGIVASSLIIPSLVLARDVHLSDGSVDCDTGIFTSALNGATSTASQQQLNDCNGSNGSPLLVMQPWGLTGEQSQNLIFASGATVADAAGITFTCPEFYGLFGCYNLTGLDYWKSQARVIAKETNGWGKYAYWLNH